MRTLVLLRGNVGSGKSTWVKNMELTPFTISADDIRLLMQSPVLHPNGVFGISGRHDREVWALLFKLLEIRMSRGEFTVVDATHTMTTDFKLYLVLAKKYRYRLVCVDFSDVPLDVCQARNALREEYKRVPPTVLQSLDLRLSRQPLPKYVVRILPEEFIKYITLNPLDMNKFTSITFIGDIHACAEPLKVFLQEENFCADLERYYVFLGDYLDRGIQPVEVIELLMRLVDLPNVLFLEGNHEQWLRYWAHFQEHNIKSGEFNLFTKKELNAANLDRAQVRKFCNKFAQLGYFAFSDKVLLGTHGGLSTLPKQLVQISAQQLIHGTGKYNDMHETAKAWKATVPTNHIQFAGHRNLDKHAMCINDQYYNLEGGVEFGGVLRVATVSKSGIVERLYPNYTYRRAMVREEELTPEVDLTFVKALRSTEKIREKVFGNISSFNYSKKVFFKQKWDSLTLKARGLFVNTHTGDIVSRSYDKFFNINESQATSVKNLRFAYPVQSYIKENGFLGILGYDKEQDTLVYSTKSLMDSDYVMMFKNAVLQRLADSNYTEDDLRIMLADTGISLSFEVIDPVKDPHIIEYTAPDLILLDAVSREESFKIIPIAEVLPKKLFKTKRAGPVFVSREEFELWYKEISSDMSITDIEGYVLHDEHNLMMKIKLPFYQKWKILRRVKDDLRLHRNIMYAKLFTPEISKIYQWLQTLPIEDLNLDIITLRNQYVKDSQI